MFSASDSSISSGGVAASPVAVDTKLDGIRIQAHKVGEAVRLFTRSLDDITARLPDVVEVVRALPAKEVVLDGEAIAFLASEWWTDVSSHEQADLIL